MVGEAIGEAPVKNYAIDRMRLQHGAARLKRVGVEDLRVDLGQRAVRSHAVDRIVFHKEQTQGHSESTHGPIAGARYGVTGF